MLIHNVHTIDRVSVDWWYIFGDIFAVKKETQKYWTARLINKGKIIKSRFKCINCIL